MMKLAPACFVAAALLCNAACSDSSGSSACPAATSCASGGAPGAAGGGSPNLAPLGGGDSSGAGESGCISEQVEFDTRLPNVMLLVDTSASMTIPDFSGESRWQALEQALFGTDGMVPTLEEEMRFGLTLYASSAPAPSEQVCPFLREEPLALHSAEALAQLFRATTPRGTTPTGESLEQTWPKLAALPEDITGPRIIVLATDGEPTLCGATDQQDAARQVSATAVEAAFAGGVTTFVVAVGNELGEPHLRELANLGQGFPAADAVDRSYRALDGSALAGAFRAISVRARSCEFELRGVVQPGAAHLGTVLLDGSSLGYEDPDGWVLEGPSQLNLQGAACEAVRNGASSIDIRFPCGTVVPK